MLDLESVWWQQNTEHCTKTTLCRQACWSHLQELSLQWTVCRHRFHVVKQLWPLIKHFLLVAQSTTKHITLPWLDTYTQQLKLIRVATACPDVRRTQQHCCHVDRLNHVGVEKPQTRQKEATGCIGKLATDMAVTVESVDGVSQPTIATVFQQESWRPTGKELDRTSIWKSDMNVQIKYRKCSDESI